MRSFVVLGFIFYCGISFGDEAPLCIPRAQQVEGLKLWTRKLMSAVHLCDYSLSDNELAQFRADVLLRIVQGKCLRNLDSGCGPGPCESVDVANGCAILKDLHGTSHMLAIPTKKVLGVEDAQLLAKDSPNYWQCALGATQAIGDKLGKKLEREQVAFGINAVVGRSREQLHIHADCVAPWMLKKIKKFEHEITDRWSEAKYGLYDNGGGPLLRVRLVRGRELNQVDPFKLVNEELKNDGPMAEHSISVLPVKLLDGQPGFYIFDSTKKYSQGFDLNGERFLDRECEILKQKVSSNFR